MTDIKAVQNNPVHKQAVKDLLAIDDIAGYQKDAATFVAGYEPASFTVNLLELKTLGVSQETEAQLIKPKADLLKIQKNLLKKLTDAEKETYKKAQKKLTKPESKKDLHAALKTLPNSPNKQTITDLLIIDDIAGYTKEDGTFVAGYEPARFAANMLSLSSLGVSTNIETALTTPKADIQIIQQGLLGKLDGNAKKVYTDLRDRMTLAESGDDLVTAYCTLDAAESFCPAISLITPNPKQGQTLDITISGSNLAKDPKVELGDKITVNSVKSAESGMITLNITVAADAKLGERKVKVSTQGDWLTAVGKVTIEKADDLPPYCDDNIDNDKDGKVDAADEDCAPGGKGEIAPEVKDPTDENVSTKMQIAAYWLQKKLKLQVPVQLGGGGIVGNELNDAPVWNRAAVETTNTPPNVKAGISVNPTIVGKEDEDAFVKYDPITLKVNARFNYAGYLQNQASHLLDAGAGFELKLNTDQYVAPSVYFHWEMNNNDYGFPNKWFYNGLSNQLTPGLALTHEAGKWLPKFPFRATLFSEYRHTFFNWDKQTQGYEFSGIDQAVWMGAELLLPFTKLNKHGAIPDLTLRAGGILAGQHEVPEVIGSPIGSSFEQMNGWEMEGKLQWNNLDPYNPYLRGGYRSLELEGWPSVSEGFWAAGVYAPDAGQFEVRGGTASNITPYYDESQSFYLQGSWTPTEDWLDGRLSAITLSMGCSLTNDMNQKGYNQLYAFVGFDPIKLVTGKAPDKLVYASDKPADKPAAEPQPHPAVKPPKPASEFEAKKYLDEQCKKTAGTDAAKCASSYKGDNTKSGIDSHVKEYGLE